MVWPPQNTGIFGYSAPCCCANISVSTNCRSKTQTGASVACTPSAGFLPDPYTFSGSVISVEGNVFDVAYTLTPVVDCNATGSSYGYGTFTYTLSGLSVTTINPLISGIDYSPPEGLFVDYGQPYTPMNDGDTVSIPYCSGLRQIYINLKYTFAGMPDFGDQIIDPNVPSSYDSSPGVQNTGEVISSILSDSGVPYDMPADCSYGYVNDRTCPGGTTIDFRWFETQAVITGLTTGQTYCLQFAYEYSTDSGGTWTPLSALCVSFVATSDTETTDFYSIDPAEIVGLNIGADTWYRLQSGFPTCVADPGGTICAGCPNPVDDGP